MEKITPFSDGKMLYNDYAIRIRWALLKESSAICMQTIM